MTVAKNVELKGEALDNLRLSSVTAQNHLLAIGAHTLKELGVPEKEIKAVVVIFNNMKELVLDKDFHLVGVYQDPPGICREPTKKEKADWEKK